MPMGGEGDLPLHPAARRQPRHRRRDRATARATSSATAGSTTSIRPRPPTWTLFDPLVDGDGDGTAVRDLGAYRAQRALADRAARRARAGSRPAHASSPSRAATTAAPAPTYAAASATNEFVTYALPIGEAGRYDVSIGVRQDPAAGKFQVAIADDPAGPWTPARDRAGRLRVDVGVRLARAFRDAAVRVARREARAVLGDGQERRQRRSQAVPRLHRGEEEHRAPVRSRDIAAGGNHTCALTSRGGVRCWGANVNGQLGDGSWRGSRAARPPSTSLRTSPPSRPAPRTRARCPPAASVRCWGLNSQRPARRRHDHQARDAARRPGALGRQGHRGGPRAHLRAHDRAAAFVAGAPTAAASSATARPPTACGRPTTDVLSGVKAISRRRRAHLRADDAGGVRCWGANSSGQLGDGTMDDRPRRPRRTSSGDIAAVSAGDTHTCAVTNAGGVRCWGSNTDGQLGDGTSDPALSPPDHRRALRRHAGRRQPPRSPAPCWRAAASAAGASTVSARSATKPSCRPIAGPRRPSTSSAAWRASRPGPRTSARA